MKVSGLDGLRQIQQKIAAERALAAEREQARRALEEHQRAEREIFTRTLRQTMGQVAPLPAHDRARLAPVPPRPLPAQRELDDQAALRESLSDEFDVATLLDTDDALSFRRSGIGADVLRKLRRGDWSIQAQIDLHGLRRDEARETLGGFIRDAHKRGLRCLRVVHGKGLGSPGKTPVLKSRVQGWLVQKDEVIAFVQARPVDGGAGALLVLLKAV